MTTKDIGQILTVTERFLIRRLCLEDVTTTYLSWFQDEDTKRYIVTSGDATSLAALREYVKEKRRDPRIVFCGIFERHSKKHIGNIKFEPTGNRTDTMELGILIGDPEWRSKGVGKEVITACGNKLSEVGVTKIYLGVQKQNSAAIKLYENVGFQMDNSKYLPIDPELGVLMSWDISTLSGQKT